MPRDTRTISIPTSPRSPYKVPPELELLRSFIGRPWNHEVQVEFGRRLSISAHFEGSGSTRIDWTARDRISRAPLTLGFVRTSPVISITPAGEALLAGNVEEMFLRQMLKWQYPSPTHQEPVYRQRFCIKPFLETLRLIYDCDGLTKDEFQLFAVTMIRYQDYEATRRDLLQYRSDIAAYRRPGIRRFRKECALRRFQQLYADELAQGRIRLRQNITSSPQQYIETKLDNARDYGDAFMRYSRGTGLFVLSGQPARLRIKDHRLQFVQRTLSTIEREPEEFDDRKESFLADYENPELPVLPSQDPQVLTAELQTLCDRLHALGISPERTGSLIAGSTVSNARNSLEILLRQENRKRFVEDLRHGQERLELIADLADVMITRNTELLVERNVLLEWHLWRVFEMLNHGTITTHMLLDENCLPLDHAPGGGPDLEASYEQFHLVIEVTTSQGERQHDMEREPISRHYGDAVRVLKSRGDVRPVYGLFIAPSITQATIAYLFLLRKQSVDHYGGKARFVPLSIADFVTILRNTNNVTPACAFDIMRDIDNAADQVSNETEWHRRISEIINAASS